MPTAPPRRFDSTPVETTSRSSKQDQAPYNEAQVVKPRHLVSQLVEGSARPSKENNAPERGDLEELKHEHKIRRFAPQPIESTKRSSRDNTQDEGKESNSKVRRFAPEPIETSRSSSKDKLDSKTHIKFKPQLVETSHSSTTSRKTSEAKTVRRFAPMVIDTATRTRKTRDTRSISDSSAKTEDGHDLAAREHRRHITGTQTPLELDENETAVHVNLKAIDEHNALRPLSPLDGSSLRTKSQQRQHSFRCPDLDTIDSSESDRDSDTSSTPELVQGSPITASDSSFNEYKHATRARESVDGLSNYILQLEAKRAEKRLRDQALAAFPNSDFHEPVQHYIDGEKDSDSDVSIDYRPVTYDGDEDDVLVSHATKRDSTALIQLEMQQHAENLDQERRANQITAKQPTRSPWWRPEDDLLQADRELRTMRDRARPPMLGGDIEFPRCQSPEPTRFDVTQGAAALRDQMDAERVASQSKSSDEGATLWSDATSQDNIKSTNSSKDSTGSSSSGLWGGFCTQNGKKAVGGMNMPIMPSGLVTPRSESQDVFDQSFALPHSIEMAGVAVRTPPTPEDMPGTHSINSVLVTQHELEKSLELEYPDSFITQVYNYLSLGYPSLARSFDAELSKISLIPLADLRGDDVKARDTPRGYIRLGTDFEGGGGVEREESCMRWVALKRYVHEWARQEKTMSRDQAALGNAATAARRGSWGN